jgi:hypothetical protein
MIAGSKRDGCPSRPRSGFVPRTALKAFYKAFLPKHLPDYLGAFCWTTNHRRNMRGMMGALAVTRDGGMVATVMPHGVLFRGGDEKAIRAGIIDDDLLEAVIGVAPNLFYGTQIPAAILVLRQRVQQGANRISGKPPERQGKVLFINADREFFEGALRTTCCRSISRRSSRPSTSSAPSMASRPSRTMRR